MGLVTNRMPAREIYKPYDATEKKLLKKKYGLGQMEAIAAGEKAIDPEHLKTQAVLRSDIGALNYMDDLGTYGVHIDRKLEKRGARGADERMMTQDEYAEHMSKHLMETGSHVPIIRRRIRAFENYWTKDKTPCFKCGEPGHTDITCVNKALSPAEAKALKTEWETVGRLKALEEVDESTKKFKLAAHRLQDLNKADSMRAYQNFTGWIGSKGPIIDDPSTNVGTATTLAPTLPKDLNSDEVSKLVQDPDGPSVEDPEGQWDRLRRATGIPLQEIRALSTRLLVRNFVSNQTRLGKIQSLYVIAIAGDGKGRLGIGESKGSEDLETIQNARMAAIRNLAPIPMYENRTIFGEVEGKVGATEVKLMSRPPGKSLYAYCVFSYTDVEVGFGLRCQSLIFEMCKAAGIRDMSAKVPRSRNKMNTVKAAYAALMSQRIPDDIAQGRGIKLVDVRKVYYAGRV
ncbi:37s ribosomal protein s5 [Phlyctema vagabunda]|uniref:37s ribosomal protein s5 n=1 Tax=Phlyctema vagabunda TaxID=108571 RepID=A0ABR4PDR6_9HELO